MNTQHYTLPSATPGTSHQLTVFQFGPPAPLAGQRKVYIQAALHADEIPAMLVALALKEELTKLEAAGRLRAEVQLLTCANPLGLAQAVLGNAQGRFELASGSNYNRGFPFLAGPIATAVEGQLGSDAAANLRLIRSAWRDALQALPETTAMAALQQRLMLLAHDADLVLDLHCSKEAAMHLYTSDGLWGAVEPLARYIGARATLLALDSGAQSFDEALSYTWVQLQQKFGQRFPVPLGSVAVTVEHRGQRDVSYPLAEQDASAILHYLTRQGDIDGTAPPLPELQAPATPLAGSEQFIAPSAACWCTWWTWAPRCRQATCCSTSLTPSAMNAPRSPPRPPAWSTCARTRASCGWATRWGGCRAARSSAAASCWGREAARPWGRLPRVSNTPADPSLIDSRQALWRLLATLGLVVLGNSCMYVVAVVLPAVQAEFNVGRANASLPYTLMMVCLGLGGLVTGRLADRHGLTPIICVGALAVCAGFVGAAMSGSIWGFMAAHALMGFLGSSATFAPLLADTALWWNRRRGIAVAVCASGNYIAGALWPPIVQHGIETLGWRHTYMLLGVFCGLGMLALSLRMRQRPPMVSTAPASASAPVFDRGRPFGLRPSHALSLLFVAGVACCVAMSMPQVHIVAYCTDLGFGAARGAQMLSLMLACGVVSRLVFGLICDRIGGIRTLLLGSALQGIALLLFLPYDGLVPLYVISALFGLFQGGIVPSYAIIVREHFAPQQAGAMVGAVIMATMVGMALGGWLSGWVFDVTGNYHAAFINGIGWNLLNLSITSWLYWRVRRADRGRAGLPASA